MVKNDLFVLTVDGDAPVLTFSVSTEETHKHSSILERPGISYNFYLINFWQ